MYFASVLLLLLIFPLASFFAEVLRFGHSIPELSLIGKWFIFWAVGVRLFLAGVRQVLQPSFTAIEIFGIHEPKALAIVRELGFANLSIGLLGIGSRWHKGSLIPAAFVGGLYYGLAGLGHVPRPHKNAKEYTAMISDGFAFLVLLSFVLSVA